MKARKENKVYRIDENSKARYLEEGYDIYDDDGKLIEHSPKKKISYADHEKRILNVKAEAEKLKADADKKSGK